MKIKLRKTILISLAVIIIVGILLQANIWLLLSLSLLLLIINHYSFKVTRHIFLVLFLAAFFTFLMSGQTVHDFFGYPMDYVFDGKDFSFLNSCIFLSLIFILLGYYLGNYVQNHVQHREEVNILARQNKDFRIVSKYMFYMFSISWYAMLLEQVFIVQTTRYVSLYTYKSQLPAVVDQMSEACPVAFCLFLATMPSKKEAKLPVWIVTLYACVSLLVGRRVYFVTYIFLVISYLVYRTYNNEESEVWISRKQILALVISLPILIVFLYAYKFIRYNRQIEAGNIYEAFIGFFAQQGFSANLIVAGKNNADRIPDKIYSFWGTLRFLRINVFSRYILQLDYIKNYTGSTTNLALNSGSFARIMSYLLIPVGYSKGYGVGSCYVAELYHDFGYIGICIGNFIYGYALGRMIQLDKNTTFKNTVALLMFLRLLTAPRYNYDRPFMIFISFNFWGVIILGYIGVLLLRFRRKGTVLEVQ